MERVDIMQGLEDSIDVIRMIMRKNVSYDAVWGKLGRIEGYLNQLLTWQMKEAFEEELQPTGRGSEGWRERNGD